MKTFTKILIAFLILFTYSCKNKIQDQISEIEPIFAGEYDDSFYQELFEIPLCCVLKYDKDSIYKIGNRSITIEGLVFKFYIQILANSSKDTTNLTEIFSIEFPKGVDIISNNKIYEGTTTNISSVKLLNYGTVINKFASWNSLSNRNRKVNFWAKYYNKNLCLGDYKSTLDSQYIGFRYHNKVGWIKIDIFNKNKPKIMGYALKK